MDTATAIVEQLTCLYLKAETSTRSYDVRDGYSTVFTDIFESVTSVKLDDVVLGTSDYTVKQWDRRNADWYNSIVLDCKEGELLTVTGKWVIPSELQALITSLDGILTNSKSGRVKSKRVEDFQITLNDNTDVQQFALDNAALISKYSICNATNVRNGKVC